MASTVQVLDKSGWGPDAAVRAAKFDSWKRLAAQRAVWDASPAGKAYQQALLDHPLAGVLGQMTDESIAKSAEPRWRFKSRDFGNGHKEAVVCRETPDPRKRLERAIKLDCRALAYPGEVDREESILRAVRRAKQKVRHLCKSMTVNSLWTLTFRQNVQDREVVLRCLDAFRRRVVAVLGDWRYVAVLEKQERGAFHIHLATHALPKRLTKGGVKVKSWDVMRAIWRSAAGDLGGNFDEAKRSARWSKKSKAIKGGGAIASYIAGYVAKDMMESELNRKRYSASKGVDIPDAYVALFKDEEATMHGLIELAYAAVGDRVTNVVFNAERGLFFIESDDTKQPPH